MNAMKALVTTLILGGLSSTALARPTYYERQPSHHQVERRIERREARIERREIRYERAREHARWLERERWEREHRYLDRAYRPGRRFSLIRPTSFVAGRFYVPIATEYASIQTLQLAGSGVSYVDQIVIEYRDGRTQAIAIGQWLNPENPTLEVSVPAAGNVRNIVVQGRSENGGSIAVNAF
jgi:hypothetical protein